MTTVSSATNRPVGGQPGRICWPARVGDRAGDRPQRLTVASGTRCGTCPRRSSSVPGSRRSAAGLAVIGATQATLLFDAYAVEGSFSQTAEAEKYLTVVALGVLHSGTTPSSRPRPPSTRTDLPTTRPGQRGSARRSSPRLEFYWTKHSPTDR